jgi:hypothetical protein
MDWDAYPVHVQHARRVLNVPTGCAITVRAREGHAMLGVIVPSDRYAMERASFRVRGAVNVVSGD